MKTIALLFATIAVISCRPQELALLEARDEVTTVVPSATITFNVTSMTLPTEISTATMTPASYPPIGSTTKMVLENGLIWTECVVNNREYAHVRSDIRALSSCADFPEWNEHDHEIKGDKFDRSRFSDLRLKIGDDVYETRYDETKKCCEYDLEKNGIILFRASAPFYTFDPNRNLWHIDGQVVWELISEPPDVIVDGVHYNEKYGLEGAFFPYEIKGKLIFIAKKDGKFHLVYAGEAIGRAFDDISMAYCCAMMSVMYGSGKYWFLGMRDGVMYVVTIQ